MPYVSDPAITKHLAYFLNRQAEAMANRDTPTKTRKQALGLPTAILFNGGVFKSVAMGRDPFSTVLNNWTTEAKGEKVRTLQGNDLDLAVARGAAYYGLVRRGKGIRIRGGTARAYYIGVETAMPAVPGMRPPIKALCVAPFGMEEGTESDIPSQEFGLVVGEQAEFRFLGLTLRRQDAAGTVIEEWEMEIEELSPVATTLEGQGTPGRVVPVHLHTKVTEVGQLELWCFSRDGKDAGNWSLTSASDEINKLEAHLLLIEYQVDNPTPAHMRRRVSAMVEDVGIIAACIHQRIRKDWHSLEGVILINRSGQVDDCGTQPV